MITSFAVYAQNVVFLGWENSAWSMDFVADRQVPVMPHARISTCNAVLTIQPNVLAWIANISAIQSSTKINMYGIKKRLIQNAHASEFSPFQCVTM